MPVTAVSCMFSICPGDLQVGDHGYLEKYLLNHRCWSVINLHSFNLASSRVSHTHIQSHACFTPLHAQHNTVISNYHYYKLERCNVVSWFYCLSCWLLRWNTRDECDWPGYSVCTWQVFWASSFVTCDRPDCHLSWLTWCGLSYLSVCVCVCIKVPEATCQRCNDSVSATSLVVGPEPPQYDWR